MIQRAPHNDDQMVLYTDFQKLYSSLGILSIALGVILLVTSDTVWRFPAVSILGALAVSFLFVAPAQQSITFDRAVGVVTYAKKPALRQAEIKTYALADMMEIAVQTIDGKPPRYNLHVSFRQGDTIRQIALGGSADRAPLDAMATALQGFVHEGKQRTV